MENKGLNTYIREMEGMIAKVINDSLQQGMPPTVLSLILKNTLYQLESFSDTVVEKELESSKQEENTEANETTK